MSSDPEAVDALARVITEASGPTVLAPALLIGVSLNAAHSHGWWALGWGAVAAVFVGVLPLAFLRHGVKLGRWSDHHVDDRRDRALPLAFAMVCVGAGIALLVAGDAPSQILALVVAMLVGLAAVLVVSLIWKVSIHSAVAAGTAVILGLTFGWVGWAVGVGLTACASWSRLALHKHTLAQVVVGIALGAGIAATVYPVLR